MAQLVPYYSGMQLGQGFNTYLQKVCNQQAVTVTAPETTQSGLDRSYKSELIDRYEKLAKSLNITAGAAVSGYGQSGRFDAEYLDRSEYESSTLTYQVVVDVKYQASTVNKYSFNKISTTNPNDTYGDRYIADFIRGGYFFARVSISVNHQSMKEEVKAKAEVAFSMYGASGEASVEVKTAIQSVQKNSVIRIVIRESTSSSTNDVPKVKATTSTDLLDVKERADKFYDDAKTGSHNYIRFALLQEYPSLANFDNTFTPVDYTEASQRSWTLFNDFTKYLSFEQLISRIPEDKWKDSSVGGRVLQDKRVDEQEKIRTKVKEISEDPETARKPGTHQKPDDFQKLVLRSIKTATFIVQKRETIGNYWIYSVRSDLEPKFSSVFEFQAYDFGNVIGTTLVSFGINNAISLPSIGDIVFTICKIRERVGFTTPSWTEDSHFWVFPEKIDTVANDLIGISLLNNVFLTIRAGEPEKGNGFLPHFRFYALKN